MSFDKDGTFARLSGSMSQSLWNRAMSFDQLNVSKVNYLSICLNPFGTGQCLSTDKVVALGLMVSLNPFGTGQCLSTEFIKT